MKLLIVDDSSVIRSLIKNQIKIFEKVNIVGEAGDGIMAMEMVNAHHPDLVILDLHMPGMNGIQVLREIKKTNAEIIVCILTNYPYPQYKEKCIAFGADFFLNKNEDFEMINIVIGKILREEEK